MNDPVKQRAIATYIEAWNTGDVGALDEVFSPNVTFHAPPYPDMDLAGIKQYVAGMRAGYPDLQVAEEETLYDGNSTSCRYGLKGTFTGHTPMLPVPPTGMRAAASGCSIFHWQNGQVVEAWNIGDLLGFLQKSGVIHPVGRDTLWEYMPHWYLHESDAIPSMR